MEDFNSISYERHKNHNIESFDKEKLVSWKNKNTIDYWRHDRMYCNLAPLFKSNEDKTWLTVGDGRYGTDANYLSSNGVIDVMATDISDAYLKVAFEDGFISKYKVENAESMTFKNNTFDYVLCKESYHHFPRPMTALYEMIRVAKKAVILIEPQDFNIVSVSKLSLLSLLKLSSQVIKNKIKKMMGIKPYYDFGSYEDVGNYVYTISEREIEKVGLGLNFDVVSFKSMNDNYIDGVEFEEINEQSELFKNIKKNIKKTDRRTKSNYAPSGLLIAIIHKTLPDTETLTKLEAIGFVNRKLSKNPYC